MNAVLQIRNTSMRNTSASDWKQMTMGSTATTDSKTPTTEDTPMPRNSSTISHGKRFSC